MFNDDFGFRDPLDRFRPIVPELPSFPPPVFQGTIRDLGGRVIGNVDMFGNITDPLGQPTMNKVDIFGNMSGPGVPLGTRLGPGIGGPQVRDISGRTLNALPEPFRPFGS